MGVTSAHAYCRLSTGKPEPAPGTTCEEEGALLSWRTPCVSYSVVERHRATLTFEEVRDAVDFSFAAWTDVRCGDAPVDLEVRQTEAISECSKPVHNSTEGNVNTIAFLVDWGDEGYEPDAFGVTKVWYDKTNGEIFGADMLLNEDMGDFDDCGGSPCSDGRIDIENVVTHEAGHFLGLGHSKWPNASMYFEAQQGEVKKRLLDRDDIEGLCSLYGGRAPGDACQPHQFVPTGGFEPSCEPQTTAGCGCAIAGRKGDEAEGQGGSELAALLTLLGALAVLWRAGRR